MINEKLLQKIEIFLIIAILISAASTSADLNLIGSNILEYRNKVGKFNRIEEIINIKGIGEKKFLKIKDRLTV